MIDSLKTVLNLQILTIEKTLASLNKLLETSCNNEVTSTSTTISRLVNDLVAKMVKQRFDMDNMHKKVDQKKQSNRRWNSSTSTASQSRFRRCNMSATKSKPKIDLKRTARDSYNVCAGESLAHNHHGSILVKLNGICERHQWRWKKLAFDKLRGISSSTIGTIALLDDGYGSYAEEKSRGDHSEDDSEDRKRYSLRKQDMDSEIDEDNSFDFHKFQEEFGDDSDGAAINSDGDDSERSKSPELFNATSGEPLDMDEVSNFYNPHVGANFPWAQSTSDSFGVTNKNEEKSRKRQDVDHRDDWKKAPKISTSPATSRLQRRVTFEDTTTDNQDDSFLKQLEAEMVPFFERSQQLSAIDRKWKLNGNTAVEVPQLHNDDSRWLEQPICASRTGTGPSAVTQSESVYVGQVPRYDQSSNDIMFDFDGTSEGFELSP